MKAGYALRRSFADSKDPFIAAQCKGVLPLVFPVNRAPLSINI